MCKAIMQCKPFNSLHIMISLSNDTIAFAGDVQ